LIGCVAKIDETQEASALPATIIWPLSQKLVLLIRTGHSAQQVAVVWLYRLRFIWSYQMQNWAYYTKAKSVLLFTYWRIKRLSNPTHYLRRFKTQGKSGVKRQQTAILKRATNFIRNSWKTEYASSASHSLMWML